MTILVALGCVPVGKSVAVEPFFPVSINPDLPGTGSQNLAPGMLLVATRALYDPHFGKSVVYLVQHDEAGTLGLIVNRSSDTSLLKALPDIKHKQAAAHTLNYGGPVGPSLILMLLRNESVTRGMAHVAGDVYVSSDLQVLERVLAAKKNASEVRFYIGHSGWAVGQLDFELERGSWHVVRADTDAIFSADTDSLWDRLIERLEPPGIQVENRPALPDLAMSSGSR